MFSDWVQLWHGDLCLHGSVGWGWGRGKALTVYRGSTPVRGNPEFGTTEMPLRLWPGPWARLRSLSPETLGCSRERGFWVGNRRKREEVDWLGVPGWACGYRWKPGALRRLHHSFFQQTRGVRPGPGTGLTSQARCVSAAFPLGREGTIQRGGGGQGSCWAREGTLETGRAPHVSRSSQEPLRWTLWFPFPDRRQEPDPGLSAPELCP